jgi:valyl-tRNA synthetase
MNGVAPDPGFDPATAASPLCRWLLDAANTAIAEATDALEAYRFDDYAGACYRFTWNVFCDWFVELAKPVLLGEEGAEKQEVRATAAHVLGVILRLLHPATPFVTEALWDGFGYGEPLSLIRAPWPAPVAITGAADARAELDWVIRFITAIRTVRAEMNVPPSVKTPVLLRDAAAATTARAQAWSDAASRLARVASIASAPDAIPPGSAQIVLDEATLILPLADLIDLSAERARLARDRGRAADELAKVERKLANADFVARAKPEVVEENHTRARSFTAEIERLDAALGRLS